MHNKQIWISFYSCPELEIPTDLIKLQYLVIEKPVPNQYYYITTNTTTDPIREGRSHYITTEGDVTAGRTSNKSTHDAEWDDKGLLHNDVHVLVDHSSVLQIQQG